MSGAKINQQNLVFGVMNSLRKDASQISQFSRIELAEKDGELRVVAAAFEGIEDFVPTFVVGNIVADDVMPARRHRVVMLV